MRLLANDGIDPLGKQLLEAAGFEVDTINIPQAELPEKLKQYDAITVRSATKVRKELIDACPNIRLIGRGGVGMDNIDVAYAESKGIAVVNTPAASSLSVAELVFSHLFSGIRFLQDSNRAMPSKGATEFNDLKKQYAKGIELRGKTLGICGFGRIGREAAKIAIGLGMQVKAYDLFDFNEEVQLEFADGQTLNFKVEKCSMDDLLRTSDFVTLHVPAVDGKPVISTREFGLMKKGAAIVNCARGGVIDEEALINALNSNHIAFAGLDVFDHEPTPRPDLLNHSRISVSPHIGASTNEAQERIGKELAERIIHFFKNV